LLLRLLACVALLALGCEHRDDPVQEAPLEKRESKASAREEALTSKSEPILALSTRTVDLTMAFGETAVEEVRLVGRRASSAHLRIVSVLPPGPDVVIVPAEGLTPEGVRVTDTGSKVGHQAGQITLATGLDDPNELTLLYSWAVAGNLTVDPTNPFLDTRAPDPSVAVRVQSSRQDFRLERVEILAGPFVASVERDGTGLGGYSVRVSPVPSHSDGSTQRGFVGQLRLVSNDPAEPTKDVPLFALGPLRRKDR
jgi:hypothetical protein